MSDTKYSTTKPAKGRGFTSSLNAIVLCVASFMLVACSENNQETQASFCESSSQVSEAIGPKISGDMAAFQILDEPKDVSELSFSDIDGKTTKVSAFSGKVVLFNLWATWCAPCRTEMPAFDTLQNELGGDDFTLLPVSVDKGTADISMAFYNEIGLKHLPFYHDGTMGLFLDLKKQGLAFGLPVTLLIDREGCAVAALNGPAEWAGTDAFGLVTSAIGADKKE